MTPTPFTAWASAGLDAWTLGMDASTVIGLRLARIAVGDAEAGREAKLMVAEKVEAAWEMQAALVTGRLGSTPLSGTQGLLRHYGRKVRANKRRLS